MTNYEQITVETQDRVTTITLNRPDRLNAWTYHMEDEVRDAIGRAGKDPETRCIIITGAGRGFCAGLDVEGLQGISSSGRLTKRDATGTTDMSFPDAPGPAVAQSYPGKFGYLYNCPKPIIAAINGPCVGIGLILTLYSDLRFADETAKFSTAFAARGLVAEHAVEWILPRLIGEANALDILFTSRKFSGAEAHAMGLVNKAMPGSKLMEHVWGIARVLAHDVSPRSIAVMKRQVRASYVRTFAESLALGEEEVKLSLASADFKEGVQSFVERRAPAFKSIEE